MLGGRRGFGVGVIGGARGVAVRRAGGQVPRAGHGGGRGRGAARWALRAGGTPAPRHLLGHRLGSLGCSLGWWGRAPKKTPPARRPSGAGREDWAPSAGCVL